MGSVFLETMRGHRVGLASVSLGLFVMSLIIVYTFDALGGLEAFEDLYESLPDAFAAMFRAQGGFGSTLTNYIAADYRHPVYIVAGLAFVISASSGAVAREIERGTALMLLSSPIPRWALPRVQDAHDGRGGCHYHLHGMAGVVRRHDTHGSNRQRGTPAFCWWRR